ncbi:MAG: hypothetical protein H6719_02250 [Sandaracinaceae bacterium]|nr:hypothetical protein [Sandaracinaceae bacterium]
MTAMNHRLVSFFVSVGLLTGCSVFASHDEYGAYRRVRLAHDERDRLIAAQQYVEHNPTGTWIAEVQQIRADHEEELWARSSSTREGLEWYLQVYPDGRYIDLARPRLEGFQHVEDTAAQQAAAERELRERQRQEAAEARRTWVTRAVQYWTRTMVGLTGYGRSLRRIAGSNPDFAQAFGRPPEPVCAQDEYCVKHYGQLYHIPIPGSTRIDRRVDVYLRLTMDHGNLERAEIILPDKGFSRWFEMEHAQVVTDEDPQQRFEAINWALERIQPVILEVAQGAQQVDVIPDPVLPLQVHQHAGDSDAAPTAPDEEPDAQPAQPQPQTPPQGDGQQPNEFDQLLNEAAGADATNPPPPTETTPQDTEVELVLPIGLIAYRFRNLQITVLAAGDEDYGEAFDGVIIERVRD